MATAVLDTDVLSLLARADANVHAKLGNWLNAGNGIVISRVSVYEFRRGVHSGSVSNQEGQAADLFLSLFAVVELDEPAWELGAKMWGELARQTGRSRRGMDADILIAATALCGGYEVATRNQHDFRVIQTLRPQLVVHVW